VRPAENTGNSNGRLLLFKVKIFVLFVTICYVGLAPLQREYMADLHNE